MQLVLTNDDGIEAPGLEALCNACTELGETLVIAPRESQSGVGHKVTTRTPLSILECGEERYQLNGTPADCARVALTCLARDAGWLIAGINRGGNLGADFYPSGTIAAAREAALLGCRAMAVSQYVKGDRQVNWESTARRARHIISLLLDRPLEPGHYWNVNLPHPGDDKEECEVVFCPLDPGPLHVRYRQEDGGLVYDGSYLDRPRRPGHDVDVCFSGGVAVTLLSLDINSR